MHAKPCFYCIVLLTTLFVTSCYWQPFPLDSPLSIPWSENITTFAEALNASLPSNFSQPLPTVVRAVDRCWCDFSGGSFFEPFNVSHWELLTIQRLKSDLERSQRARFENTTPLLSNSSANDTSATQSSAPSTHMLLSAESTEVLNLRHGWSLSFFKNLIRRERERPGTADGSMAGEGEDMARVRAIAGEEVQRRQALLRKEYDLQSHGFDLILDFNW
ncbi:hypothetical protein AX17_000424 [Amanita inopinata Kibby_2008]|nr:hypothetical protein AX17_000424 [Amanita inopinata Kibby_2008]